MSDSVRPHGQQPSRLLCPHYSPGKNTRVGFHFLLPTTTLCKHKPVFRELEGKCKVSSVQSLSRVWLFVMPWTVARQASLSIINSWSLLRLISIELVMPSNHLILCHPLLLPPSIFPSIRVFSNELVLHNRWPKYWSFSFSISPSNEYSALISFKMQGRFFLISAEFNKENGKTES